MRSALERDQLATSGAALVADINLTASDFCYGSVAEVRVSATDMVPAMPSAVSASALRRLVSARTQLPKLKLCLPEYCRGWEKSTTILT